MALNPNQLAQALWDALKPVAALNDDGSPSDDEPTGNFTDGFVGALNSYAMEGEVPGADNSGGDTSLIESLLNQARSNESSVDVSEFAFAMANFWSTVAVEPGDPGHGGNSVVSVTNNALAHVSDFESAITASFRDTETKPYFLHFTQNLQSMAISKITWTVIEMFNSGPSTFEANIN